MDLSAGVAPPPSSGAQRLDAIKLAKSSKWDELKRLVDAEPLTAQQRDSYGMLPLHWACTEPHSIGEGVLLALLKAFPAGARAANTAEMLPLQIAIKAQAKIEWLQALLASYPDAVLKKTPTGEHAVELAKKAALPPRSVRLLEEMYLHVCHKAGYASDHLYEDEGAAVPPPPAHRGSAGSHGSGSGSGSAPDDSVFAMQQHMHMQGLPRGGGGSSNNVRSAAANGGGARGPRRPSHPDAFKSRAYSDHDFQQPPPDALPMAYRSAGGGYEMPPPSFLRGASTSSTGSGGSGGGGGAMAMAPSAGAPQGIPKPLPFQVSTQLSSRTVVSLPPRWMNAPNCHICSQKWSTFRKRHHCRNCGQSICGDHSARERMRLPHYGLPDKYRVCTVCHHTLRTAAAELLQPGLVPRGASTSSAAQPLALQRRSDERGSALHNNGSMLGSAGSNSFQLERHVSAPARPMMDHGNGGHQDYHGIQDQVASLQMQVSQLLEQKELAESQLRAQAELLGGVDPYQRTSSSTGAAPHVGRRDRLNSVPIKLPGAAGSYQGSNGGGLPPAYGSYDVNARLTRSTESSDREVEIEYGALSMSSAVPEPPTSTESGPVDAMARLQEDLGSMSFVSSYSEFDDRSTEVYDDDDYDPNGNFAGHSGVLEEGEEGELDDDDDDEGDSTLPEVEVLVNLGLSMLNKGSCSAAVQAFTRAVEICPDQAVLYAYLAKAHYADDNLDDATVALTKSLELEPSAANWTLLGKILFEKGDHEKAIEAYQKSLEYQNAASS